MTNKDNPSDFFLFFFSYRLRRNNGRCRLFYDRSSLFAALRLVRSSEGTRSEREKEREASVFSVDKSSAQSDRSSCRQVENGTISWNNTSVEWLERGPQVRLYLVNVCPPLTFSELSKTVNVCSANYVTPSNCFTKQVGECAFTRRYIYTYTHVYGTRADDKRPGPLQISFPLV